VLCEQNAPQRIIQCVHCCRSYHGQEQQRALWNQESCNDAHLSPHSWPFHFFHWETNCSFIRWRWLSFHISVSAAEFWGFLAHHAIAVISQGIRVEGHECFLSPCWDGSDCLAQGLDDRGRHRCVICAKNTALYLPACTLCASVERSWAFCWLKSRAMQRIWVTSAEVSYTSYLAFQVPRTLHCLCSC